MDPSSAHHQLVADDHSLENIMPCSKLVQQENMLKKPTKPQPQQALKCPRCESTNTKFCYYNNYSLSQPRYFCKSCRRYWTKGGTLRNVPIGGGFRKTKRPSSSLSSSNSKRNMTFITNQDYQFMNPTVTQLYDSNASDLLLHLPLSFAQLSNGHHIRSYTNDQLSLDHGFLEARGLNFHNPYYGFADNAGSVSGVGGGGVNNQELMFPSEEEKQELESGGREISEIRNFLGGNTTNNYPWQINGDGSGNYEFNSLSMRGNYWNNGFIGSSNYHALLNSPLV